MGSTSCECENQISQTLLRPLHGLLTLRFSRSTQLDAVGAILFRGRDLALHEFRSVPVHMANERFVVQCN